MTLRWKIAMRVYQLKKRILPVVPPWKNESSSRLRNIAISFFFAEMLRNIAITTLYVRTRLVSGQRQFSSQEHMGSGCGPRATRDLPRARCRMGRIPVVSP